MKTGMLINLLSGSLGALFLYLYQQIGVYLKNKRLKKNLCIFVINDLLWTRKSLKAKFAYEYITPSMTTTMSAWKNILPDIIRVIPPYLAGEVIYSYDFLELTIDKIKMQDTPTRRQSINDLINSKDFSRIEAIIEKLSKYAGIHSNNFLGLNE